MSDFEKDEELKEKYNDVMESIADDIRQINLADGNDARTFEFNDEAKKADGETLNKSALEAFDTVKHEDETEFEAVSKAVSETGFETKPETEFENEPATVDEYNKFLESINSINFDDPDEVLRSVGAGIAGFDDAPITDADSFANNAEFSDIPEDYPDTLSCDECRDLLYDYVSDAVEDEKKRMSIGAHLRNCEMCRLELDEIKDMIGVLSNSLAPPPPLDLVACVHDRLVEAAPEVKEEYENFVRKTPADRIRDIWDITKEKTNSFIKHANWRVIAPAALSAVLVVGVAGSGVYQVMKSSDEIYDFSDNAAIANASATAKPSSSGLDEYITGDNGSKESSSTGATAAPSLSTASPATAASPTATLRPSTSAASGLTLGSGSTGTASSAASSRTTGTSSSAASSRATGTTSGTASGTASRTTSNFSTATATAVPSRTTSATRTTTTAPVATAAPTAATSSYVTPSIILPDIASGVTSPTYVTPETIKLPENPTSKTYSDTSAASATSAIAAPTSKPDATAAPTSTPMATPRPLITSAGGAASSSDVAEASGFSAAPSSTATPNPKHERNDKGETEAYAEKFDIMDEATIISCEIEDREIYNLLMNSELADCSKVDENGETTLYFEFEEYVKFKEFLEENNLTYELVTLGSSQDVMVIIPQATKDET